MSRITLPLILRTDAVANLAGGALLLALAGWFAPSAGLDGPGPVLALAALFLANGVANAVVARRTTPGGVAALAAVDVAFAGVAIGVAVLDPTGADTAVRWSLAGMGELSAAVGVGKVLTLRASKTTITAP